MLRLLYKHQLFNIVEGKEEQIPNNLVARATAILCGGK